MKKKYFSHFICCMLLFGFLLGIHEGRVALWKDGESTPWRIFPYPSAVLPAQTQAELKKGIRIDNMDDLNRLLENLLS